ncbi:MAG: UDP-2,3-diacylglucosamine diphosphatase [Rhodocyclaceae bacterium]|nr:UDP-2,3-diacylglucosamine diphosphatase [Rhodocyclaceae bacterium]
MILFASDLHLSPERPAAARAFLDFLAGPAREADEVFLLGDVFDVWAGDDDLSDPFIAALCAGMKALAASGVPLHFQRGNRDFLVGDAFAATCGCNLLGDEEVRIIAGVPTLILHGDTLCSDDTRYQAFRNQVRSPVWQAAFLGQPLGERKAQIAALREKNREEKEMKVASIMDVAAATVEDAFRRHGVSRMIHGHTHRPACHDLLVDGRPCQRWVLPEWTNRDDGSCLGGYLCGQPEGWRLRSFPDPA